MSEGRTLNVNKAVDHVHVLMGSQNRHQYSVNCAALIPIGTPIIR